MPAGMFGANTDELRGVAQDFALSGTGIDSAAETSLSASQGVVWFGVDATLFKDVTTPAMANSLNQLAALIDERSDDLVRQADEQDECSSNSTSGGSFTDSGDGVSGDEVAAFPWDKKKDEMPHVSTDSDKWHEDRDAPVDLDTTPYDEGQGRDLSPVESIRQHAIGDCWLLAALGAIAKQDPNWPEDHITYDALTNTYKVTLYDKNGQPYEVTVENSFLKEGNGVTGPNSQPNWASIYEKALAQDRGGSYSDIDGGHSEDAMQAITGRKADKLSLDPWFSDRPSLDDLDQRLSNGQALTAGSEHTRFFDEKTDPNVVNGHAYVITDVDPQNGTVTLANPWGPDGGPGKDGNHKDGSITMSADDFYRNFDDVQAVQVN